METSMELTKMIYQITNDLSNDEKFEMISQLKRVSVPANIVEGAARQTKKEFKQFLFKANGAISETDTLIELALKLNFIDKGSHQDLSSQLEKVSAMNNGLIKSLNQQIAS